MAITRVHCPVAQQDVFRVTDLEGATLRVVCAEYEEATGACLMKTRAGRGGPLGTFLVRAQEGTLSAPGVRCSLV